MGEDSQYQVNNNIKDTLISVMKIKQGDIIKINYGRAGGEEMLFWENGFHDKKIWARNSLIVDICQGSGREVIIKIRFQDLILTEK